MKTLILGFLIAVIAIVFSGCSTSEEIAKEGQTQIFRSGSRSVHADMQADTYVIRKGDQIQIAIWGYSEFNTTANVKEVGTISVPLIGDVPAAGSTKQQFEEELRKRLSEYIQGEIKLTVTIVSVVVQKVTVIGAVTRQENYPLPADATLLEIVSTAGGVTPDSDLRHVRIIRGGMDKQPIEVDLTSFIENGDVTSIPIIHPGDTVFIPKRENVIRELSDFVRDAIFIFGFFRVFN